VGFLNPQGLAKGAIEFVPTPLSIWNAEAALFDEINRANPFIQSKLHEPIRTRRIMGLPTKLKLVFAAVNPPQTYQAGYMDLVPKLLKYIHQITFDEALPTASAHLRKGDLTSVFSSFWTTLLGRKTCSSS
jgi:hypothetical protein